MTLMSSASGQLTSASTINALKGSFDESVISEHIESHHGLAMAVSAVLGSLHTLSEQTYENKALVFGCLLDPSKSSTNGIQFPEPFLGAKKYKALSDGFKTAYHVAKNGAVMDFVELQRMSAPDLSERNFYPDWTEPMARVSRKGKCGITLTRQGDLLVFEEGTLRFTPVRQMEILESLSFSKSAS
jgi:hypothetical protein